MALLSSSLLRGNNLPDLLLRMWVLNILFDFYCAFILQLLSIKLKLVCLDSSHNKIKHDFRKNKNDLFCNQTLHIFTLNICILIFDENYKHVLCSAVTFSTKHSRCGFMVEWLLVEVSVWYLFLFSFVYWHRIFKKTVSFSLVFLNT